MRIILLAPAANPLVKRLFNELKLNGQDVYLVSFGLTDNEEEKTFSLGKLSSFSSYLFSFKLLQIIKKIKPDIIHAHIINHYGILTLPIVRIPICVTLWGSDVLRTPVLGGYFKRTFFKLLNIVVAYKARGIHSSSSFVIHELMKSPILQINKKICMSFYWGASLPILTCDTYTQVKTLFEKKYGLVSDVVVFPRGMNEVYNPSLCARLINMWGKVSDRKIVVLKAFTESSCWDDFLSLVENRNVIYVNELLNECELSFLYSNSKYHVNLPFTDNLGGGVIEPAQFGSYPVLSEISTYKDFQNSYPATYISNELSDKELKDFVIKLEGISSNNTKYPRENVTNQFLEFYLLVLKSN